MRQGLSEEEIEILQNEYHNDLRQFLAYSFQRPGLYLKQMLSELKQGGIAPADNIVFEFFPTVLGAKTEEMMDDFMNWEDAALVSFTCNLVEGYCWYFCVKLNDRWYVFDTTDWLSAHVEF